MPVVTSFSDILLNYAASVFTDDIRWKDELARNAALFLRLKSLYVHSGVARFVRPAGMQQFLSYTDCASADFYYTTDSVENLPLTVNTDQKDFTLFNVGFVGKDKFGNPYYTPVTDIEYDSATGNVTIKSIPSAADSIPKGQTIQFDFYTDGVFDNELSNRVRRILGMCVAYDWFLNLSSSFLDIVPKISDSSFSIKSENEWTRVTTERRRQMAQELNAEQLSYEQDCFAAGVIPVTQSIQPI